ncbi:MAG TPA: DNA repair exonuclease [Acidimicrobiales bacterium]|nr:DNA repair exonuclease [Acidimicrobiales bacterium]
METFTDNGFGGPVALPSDWCFVHASDLHLDTPFEGLRATAPHMAEAVRDASLAAFERIVDLAVERQARFVVLAGDIYDGAERGIRAQIAFRRGVERLSECGISVFVAHGNHDPVEEGWSAIRSWPPLVHIFPAGELGVFEVGDGTDRYATVQGISFPRRDVSENLSLRFRRPSGAGAHIGVLHCNVSTIKGHANYSPCRIEDLEAARLDYFALGHIHTRSVLSSDPDGSTIAYSGNTQGRSLRESERGPKGAVVVRMRDDKMLDGEFVACDAVRFEQADIDIEALSDVGDLATALSAAAEGFAASAEGRPVISRARLTGRGALHYDLLRGGGTVELLAELRRMAEARGGAVWWDSVDDRTNAPATRRDGPRSTDFASDLEAVAQAIASSPESLRRLVEEVGAPLPRRLLALTSRADTHAARLSLLESAIGRALDLVESEQP